MTDTRYHLATEVTAQLQISPSILRRWSNEFADFLSDSVGQPQGESTDKTTQRRYSDQDIETLMTIKGLLAEGLSYVQVGKRLEAQRKRQTSSETVGEDGRPQVTALGPALRESSYGPAMSVLADTLHTVADGQQLLLGSQQANRELLTVVLQDNFGLKEENVRLRDRMLEVERDMVEMRRVESMRREGLEARLRRLEELIRPQTPRSKQENRSGCLGQLLGL
jgi:DNA-binding transcriptional MerR regulator